MSQLELFPSLLEDQNINYALYLTLMLNNSDKNCRQARRRAVNECEREAIALIPMTYLSYQEEILK